MSQSVTDTGLWRAVALLPKADAEAAAAELDREDDPAALSLSLFEDRPHGSAARDAWRLEALYTDEETARAATALLTAQTQSAIRVEPVPPTDWLAKALDGLPPVRAGRFFVHGAHAAGQIPPGTIPLWIEAGLAFGTGHHGTTLGCLEVFDQLLRTRRPGRVLDLGCGTGVLAIAAARCALGPVIASDLDADAVRVTRENAALNHCGQAIRVLKASGLSHPILRAEAPYDLIFANILARPLMRMAADIAAVCAPGGTVLISGLLTGQERMVLATFTPRGFVVANRHRRQGWTTLELRRSPY